MHIHTDIDTLIYRCIYIFAKHRDTHMQTYTNIHSFADSRKHKRTPTDTKTRNGLETRKHRHKHTDTLTNADHI